MLKDPSKRDESHCSENRKKICRGEAFEDERSEGYGFSVSYDAVHVLEDVM